MIDLLLQIPKLIFKLLLLLLVIITQLILNIAKTVSILLLVLYTYRTGLLLIIALISCYFISTLILNITSEDTIATIFIVLLSFTICDAILSRHNNNDDNTTETSTQPN